MWYTVLGTWARQAIAPERAWDRRNVFSRKHCSDAWQRTKHSWVTTSCYVTKWQEADRSHCGSQICILLVYLSQEKQLWSLEQKVLWDGCYIKKFLFAYTVTVIVTNNNGQRRFMLWFWIHWVVTVRYIETYFNLQFLSQKNNLW